MHVNRFRRHVHIIHTIIINTILIVFIEPGLLGGRSHSDTINLYCLYCTSRFARRVISNGLEIYTPERYVEVIINYMYLITPIYLPALCTYIVLFFPLISRHSFIPSTKESWKQTKFAASLLGLYHCSRTHL